MFRKYLFLILFTLQCTAVLPSYISNQSPTFEISPDPYGWFNGYSRKVQVNLDPLTGEMISALYRCSDNEVEDGVAGGMTAEWPYGGDFSCFAQDLYVNSTYTGLPLPGSRAPFVSEFINGYVFGLFNHFDVMTGEEDSFPYFTTGDASFGWYLTFWSEPEVIASADSLISPPSAWNGTGDVVYDPVSEYYYWTTAWREGIDTLTTEVNCSVGRTKTPGDPESWIWSDYRNLRFDTDNIVDKMSDVSLIGPLQIAYAKDIYGNGTGKGIGVAVTQCYPWYAPNLSYFYTNNWGGDSLSGSWEQNWNKSELGFHHQPLADLFDWVGETLTITDSIGFDLNTNTVFADSATITIDCPRIMWDVSVVATENNIVHVLCMVFPASSLYDDCIFPWTDNGYRAGYYDIRGEITDTGVNWMPAVLIANPIDNFNGWRIQDWGMEFASGINRNLSISYAGNDRIITSWLDKPETRGMPFDFPGTPRYFNYFDDGYMIISLDGGNNWQNDKTVEALTNELNNPAGTLDYAANITKTGSLVEEGWTIASHGITNSSGYIYTYAVSQYPDFTNDDPELTYMDYQRFLKAWRIIYYTSAIEPGEVSLAAGFELFQNYPNPFNPETDIRFSLSDNAEVKLSIYNTNGQLVRTLADGKKGKGSHDVKFDASDLNSGMYFYKLTVNGISETKKMILLK